MVNPHWPVKSNPWVKMHFGSSVGTINATPTANIVMFCHYSLDHACAMDAGASVTSGRRWLDSNNVPYGW